MLKLLLIILILNIIKCNLKDSFLCLFEDKDFINIIENILNKLITGNGFISITLYIVNSFNLIKNIIINCFNYNKCINKL